MRILTITGYKPMEMNIFKPNDEKVAIIKEAIRKRLIAFIEEGLEWVLISGQMGVELWTSEIIQDLKEYYPIQIGIIPPFEGQDERWPEHYQALYQEMTMCADFFQPLYHTTYKGPYQFKARDKWLIDKSDGCLLLLDEDYPGSTRFFYQAAKKENEHSEYPIFTITPFDLEDTVQELLEQNPDYRSIN